jgi:hypothetical protein
MNTATMSGRQRLMRFASILPFISGITMSVSRRSMRPACSSLTRSASVGPQVSSTW